MIRRDAIHIPRGRGHTAEEIPAAHDQSNLDLCAGDFRNFAGECFDAFGIDAKRTVSGEHFPGNLQQNAAVFCQAVSLCDYSAAGVSAGCASPTLKRTNRETEMFSPNFAIFALITSATVV